MYFLIRVDLQKNPNAKSDTIQLWGHAIRLEKYGTFIIDHRHEMADPTKPYIGYALTEPKTGMICGIDDSVREVVGLLNLLLRKPIEVKKFRSMIEEWVKENGVLNEVEI